MSDEKIHFEQYLYLPALTHDAAIIAWGGFFFKYKGESGHEKWDDESLEDNKMKGRKQSIGVKSEPYGEARVILIDPGPGGETRECPAESNTNHVVITGLKPDTEYRYSVQVKKDGQWLEWAEGPRRDWNFSKDEDGGLWLLGEGKDREYENVFRTFPDPALPAGPLTFAVIGDFGQGIEDPADKEDRKCQREVAEALEHAVKNNDVRFILTTGDNIYADRKFLIFTHDEGEEDDDWFFTYFQPYRYIINRVPVFPVIGNHDSGETEKEADRQQIYDNFYLAEPYRQLRKGDDFQATSDGLFYRFVYGSGVEFFCLDTSRANDDKRCFEQKQNRAMLAEWLQTAPAPWRIAFSHHPAYCAGPQHRSEKKLQAWMRKDGRPGGIRVFFSGHEHNFQYTPAEGAHYFITGGGGKFRSGKIKDGRLKDIGAQAWGGNEEGHFLLVKIEGDEMSVWPHGHLAQGRPCLIKLNFPEGSSPAPGNVPPFVINRV
jgi:hypothetical protein